MVVTFIVFHCYPGRDEKLGIITFIILINTNINFLLSDCNTDAQTEQVEMTGRSLSSIVALPYPVTPTPITHDQNAAFQADDSNGGFACTTVALYVLGDYEFSLAALLSERIKSLQQGTPFVSTICKGHIPSPKLHAMLFFFVWERTPCLSYLV